MIDSLIVVLFRPSVPLYFLLSSLYIEAVYVMPFWAVATIHFRVEDEQMMLMVGLMVGTFDVTRNKLTARTWINGNGRLQTGIVSVLLFFFGRISQAVQVLLCSFSPSILRGTKYPSLIKNSPKYSPSPRSRKLCKQP